MIKILAFSQLRLTTQIFYVCNYPQGQSTLCVQNFLRSYVKGVYTIQNGAYERSGVTAYCVGGHNIVLNRMTEITDLLQLFVVLVKFGSDYAPREVVVFF